jgi:hypothetical protein
MSIEMSPGASIATQSRPILGHFGLFGILVIFEPDFRINTMQL